MSKGKTSNGSIRARLGLPAKAGRRKQYGQGSKPKQKPFGQGDGYIIPDRNEGHTNEQWSIIRADAKRLAQDMAAIEQIERHTQRLSDPFVFNRMRAHARAGIFP